jgi:uncharacterized membrane protein YccC
MKPAIYMKIGTVRKWTAANLGKQRARLLFCLRVTVAAAMSFALAQLFALPFHGLWAVLTAVVVIQMSLGASLRATSDYVVGTLCGAAYASALGLLFPHADTLALTTALALAVAPLAFASTLNPMFRVAPFTAVMVFLISNQFGENPIESGVYRLLEVALGGGIAVAVSLWLFPERAQALGADAAARILNQLAQALRRLLGGFTHKLGATDIKHIQDETGRAVAVFQDIVAEAERERLVGFFPQPNPGPLSRTLLRLRHDLVIIGRAAAEPLPDALARRLDAPLRRIAAACGDYLDGAARALAARVSPPPLASIETVFDDYAASIAALRQQGFTRSLSDGALERLFALSFALDQLRQHFADLGRCVQEWAEGPNVGASKGSKPRNCSGAARAARAVRTRSEGEITGRSADLTTSEHPPCANT